MELMIKFLAGEGYLLTVELHTTVGQLKSMIHARSQVPRAKQRLSVQNGHRIDLKDDTRTLQDCGLCSGSEWTVVVLIVENLQETFQVFLKTTTGVTHTYDVFPGETVSEFKKEVQNKENVAIQQQRLVYESKQLEDGFTLEHYGIKAGSTIHLILRLRGG